MEARILQAAVSIAFALPPNRSAPAHVDQTGIADGANFTIKIYSPESFRRIRASRGITEQEIMDENDQGPLITSNLLGTTDADCLFSARERFIVHNISAEEHSVLEDFLSEYSAYMAANPESYLPVILSYFRIETSAKLRVPSPYFIVTTSLLPRLHHDHVTLLDLRGDEESKSSEETGSMFLTEPDISYKHEISFEDNERTIIVNQLQSDATFLQNNNMVNYSLIISVTVRHDIIKKNLPGQAYGPDVNNGLRDDRKDTLPIRHDVAYGVKPVPQELIAKPKFSPEREDE